VRARSTAASSSTCSPAASSGGSIDSHQATPLVTNALGLAIGNRDRADEETVIHSDHGTQFTSWAFTQRAKQSGLLPSMGSVGDCYDNAVIEAFWGRMQAELLNRKRWKTRLELANAIFETSKLSTTGNAATAPSAG
jgi:putative transposase